MSESGVHRRQILTSKVDPRAVKAKAPRWGFGPHRRRRPRVFCKTFISRSVRQQNLAPRSGGCDTGTASNRSCACVSTFFSTHAVLAVITARLALSSSQSARWIYSGVDPHSLHHLLSSSRCWPWEWPRFKRLTVIYQTRRPASHSVSGRAVLASWGVALPSLLLHSAGILETS